MFRKSLLILLLMAGAVGLQACGMKPSPQESCNFVQNADLERVSWGAATPVVLYIDSTVPSVYFDAIRSAANEWNRAVGREVLKIGGWINRPGDPAQDGVNVIYYLDRWEANRSNEQARTTVYWAGDRIYEADVRINARDFQFFSGSAAESGRVDMQSLMVHELGHVLGLAHTETPQSVMARSLAAASFRRDISNDDRNSIRCEY